MEASAKSSWSTVSRPAREKPFRVKSLQNFYLVKTCFETWLDGPGLEWEENQMSFLTIWRSRSDVIHRIIAQHLKNMRPTERKWKVFAFLSKDKCNRLILYFFLVLASAWPSPAGSGEKAHWMELFIILINGTFLFHNEWVRRKI